jgi:hypothetical protein
MNTFLKGIELLPMGYSPMWVDPSDGLPHMAGWNSYRARQMHPETIRWWNRLKPDVGLAVCGEFNDLVPVDLDSSDPAVKAAFLSVMPRPLVARFGTKGAGMFYRGKIEGKNFVPGKPDADGKRRPLIEIKRHGVLTIPPTLHRKTGKPYRWMQCDPSRPARTLFDTHVEELPLITQDHIKALEKALEPWCPIVPSYTPKVVDGAKPVSDKRMHALAMGAVRRAVEYLSGLTQDRNIQLRIKARALGKFVHHEVLTDEYVRDALIGACEINGSKEKHSLKQCHWTITSGFKAAAGDDLPALEDRPYRSSPRHMQHEQLGA